jgi:hypothetical protein
MVDALNRLTELRALGISHFDMARLPSGRIKALVRYAAAAWAASIARMPTERRIATLLAFAHMFETVAQDDVRPFKKGRFSKTILDSLFSFLHL